MNVDTGEFAALTAEAEALRTQARALLAAVTPALGRAYETAYADGWADALAVVPEVPASGTRRARLTIVR
jgi:hypothetical protein